MKAEVKYTYDEQELVDMVVSIHCTNYPVPKGMRWVGRVNHYPDEIIITAVPVMNTENTEESTNG